MFILLKKKKLDSILIKNIKKIKNKKNKNKKKFNKHILFILIKLSLFFIKITFCFIENLLKL